MKMWNTYRLVVFLLSILLLTSCTGESETEPKESMAVALAGEDTTGLFRGHHMGSTPAEVRERESWVPHVDTDTLMEFHQTLGGDSTTTEISAFYAFDSFGLFEIQLDIHPTDSARVDEIIDDFEHYFTDRYGHFDKLGISKRWTTVSRSNNKVEIVLTDESEDYGEPFISVNYLEPLSDEL